MRYGRTFGTIGALPLPAGGATLAGGAGGTSPGAAGTPGAAPPPPLAVLGSSRNHSVGPARTLDCCATASVAHIHAPAIRAAIVRTFRARRNIRCTITASGEDAPRARTWGKLPMLKDTPLRERTAAAKKPAADRVSRLVSHCPATPESVCETGVKPNPDASITSTARPSPMKSYWTARIARGCQSAGNPEATRHRI